MSPRLHVVVSVALACVATAAVAAERREARDVPAFTAISLAAPIELRVTQGERDAVELEGDPESLARIETTVRDGTLRIRMLRDRGSRDDNLKARGRVTLRRVESLSVAGSGDIQAGPITGASLKLAVSGSGGLQVDGGRADSLNVSVAGSGDVDAERLQARQVAVSVAGSGDAKVWARESLSARVAGSGDVRYRGDPAVTRTVAGSGDVRRARR